MPPSLAHTKSFILHNSHLKVAVATFVITSVDCQLHSIWSHRSSGPLGMYIEDYLACVDMGRALVMVGRTGS